ncbi:c-type cytochrome biogenesis protein CcmI [Tahibacter amnicola]|uniref:C-type cytochrome biogenesis protein CcmI n=1 Tax=Tahibacter amnicola TaxID=2976241 RepID=A0ABY6BAE8_9GAMM|nr:c-type cytochrome biogenesis protein CcmI [Tahibacter amnicola]UXI67041.1 c-type cytochrome biogenesis protein CcmI [Tahibacter amnicola]
MSPVFFLVAALMVIVALAFVTVPLLRRGHSSAAATDDAAKVQALDSARAAGILTDEEYASKRAALAQNAPGPVAARSRLAVGTAATVAVLLPMIAMGLYVWHGSPDALDPANLQARKPATPADMDQAIAGLEAKLKQNPEDVEGWLLLGRAYKSMERFGPARDALKQAYDRAGNDVDVQVDYAEALALASDSRRIEGQSRQLLERALEAHPQHQRAMWLLGIADYQQGRYAEAATRWEALATQIDPSAPAHESILAQIADARQRAGMPAAAESAGTPAVVDAKSPAAPAAADTGGPRIQVEVDLDPKLKDQAVAGSTVFVFARAANGPPMPLAVQRLALTDLPAKVTLTESMSMMPSMKLSQFPQVVVGARISRSGNAIPQAGDLQTLSEPIAVSAGKPVRLLIDQVVAEKR